MGKKAVSLKRRELGNALRSGEPEPLLSEKREL